MVIKPESLRPHELPSGHLVCAWRQGSGKERYVFFSFPHISIDAAGNVGAISRPGRPGQSCACGALQQALIDIQLQGLADNCKSPGGVPPMQQARH